MSESVSLTLHLHVVCRLSYPAADREPVFYASSQLLARSIEAGFLLTLHSSGGCVSPGAGCSDDVRPWVAAGVRGHLRHGGEVLLHKGNLAHVANILGSVQAALENALDSLAMLNPLLNQRLDGQRRRLRGRHVLDGGLAGSSGLGFLNIGLALTTLGRLRHD